MKWIHLLSLIPFIGILGGVHLANRVEPYVLGLPFMMFWYLAWLLLTSVIMLIVYRLDPDAKGDAE